MKIYRFPLGLGYRTVREPKLIQRVGFGFTAVILIFVALYPLFYISGVVGYESISPCRLLMAGTILWGLLASPLVVASYRFEKRQKKMWESYELALLDDRIACRQSGEREVVIRRDEIAGIEEHAHGEIDQGLIILTVSRRKAIKIPMMLEARSRGPCSLRPGRGYSYLNATMGSILVARLAGM